VEGIAVGLASKILPHNFNELIDASIAHLQGKTFELYPDFPTGGLIDVSRYNDGLRGGLVKIRAKISKLDKKTLVISELPYGQTTTSLIDSVLKANEKERSGSGKLMTIPPESWRLLFIFYRVPIPTLPWMPCMRSPIVKCLPHRMPV